MADDGTEKLQLKVETPEATLLDALDDKLTTVETTTDRLRDAQGRFVAQGGQVVAATSAVTTSATAAAGALQAEYNAMWAIEAEAPRVAQKLQVLGEAGGTFVTIGDGASLASKGIRTLGTAAGAAAAGQGHLQQSIIAGSYAFQDFTATSGDLGAKLNSITNNIPQLLVGMGGIGVALSVAATAGVAVYRNWDSIAALWQTRNPFPKAAGDVEGLKRELDRAREAMEKFEKAGTGTTESIGKYNELRATTARLETEIAEAQERQGRLKKALESRTDEQEGRGKGFEEAIKGRGAGTMAGFRAALEKQGQHEIEAAATQRELRQQAFDQEVHTAEERKAFAEKETAIFRSIERGVRATDWDAEAKKLMDGLLTGNARAGVLLDRLMESTGTTFDGLRKRMDALDPEAKKKVDAFWKGFDADIDDMAKEAHRDKDRAKKVWDAFDDDMAAIAREAGDQAKHVNAIVADFKPRLKEQLETSGVAGFAAGRRPEAVRSDLQGRAIAAMQAGGIGGDDLRAASAKLADELLKDIRAKVGAKAATLPAPKPAAVAAKKGKPAPRPKPKPKPRTLRKPAGKKPAVNAVPLNARQRAAAALAKEQADKAAPRDAKAAEAARIESVAKRIYRGSRGETGVQFSPDQSRETAKRAGQIYQDMGQFANVGQAVALAMAEELNAMRALANKFAGINHVVGQVRAGAQEVRRHVTEQQTTAQNAGGPN